MKVRIGGVKSSLLMVGCGQVHGQEYEVLVVDTAGQDEYSIFPTQVNRFEFFVVTSSNPVQRWHWWVRDGLLDRQPEELWGILFDNQSMPTLHFPGCEGDLWETCRFDWKPCCPTGPCEYLELVWNISISTCLGWKQVWSPCGASCHRGNWKKAGCRYEGAVDIVCAWK